MPNLFPALLSATVFYIFASQFNASHAQTIISNGSTVGQQLLGPGGSILVEQGGTIDEINAPAILGSGAGLSLTNNGDIQTEFSNTLTSQTSSILLDGASTNFNNVGNISSRLTNTTAATGTTHFNVEVTGNSSIVNNSGEILSIIDATPTVAGTPDCATPIGSNFFCIGTAINPNSQAGDALTSLKVGGNDSIVTNSGVVSTIVSRAVSSDVSSVSLSGDRTILTNTGLIELVMETSSQEIVRSGFLFPNDWAIDYGLQVVGSPPYSLAPNGINHSAISVKAEDVTIINERGGVIFANDQRLFSTMAGIDAHNYGALGTYVRNDGEIFHRGTGIIINSGIVENTGEINNPQSSNGLGYLVFNPNSGSNQSLAGHIIMTNSRIVNTGIIGNTNVSGTLGGIAITNPGGLPTLARANEIFNSGFIAGGTGGIDSDQSYTLINSGEVIGGSIGIIERSGGVNSVIVNSGQISGGLTGIESDGATDIQNSGEIFGSRFGINDASSSFGPFSLSIENSGSIYGETAIESTNGNLDLDNSSRIYSTLGPAGYAIRVQIADPLIGGTFNIPLDDSITFRAGTRIIGRMDLGGGSLLSPTFTNGNDTITLDRTSPDIAWRWTFDNFDLPGQDPFDAGGIGDSLFILGNNVPYYIWNGPVTTDYGPFPSDDGITVYIPNISGIFAANGIMEDIARTVHGGIRNRLNEGWDHENLPQDLFYRSEDDIVLRDGSDLIGAPLEALDPAVFRKAPPLTVWAKGFGGIRNEAGTDNYGDYSHLWMGGMAGLDLRSSQGDENDDGLRDTEDDDHWNIGILGGYVQSDLTFASGFKDIQSDFFFAGAYGRLVRDALYLDASVIGGFGGMSEYGPIANNLVPGGIENPGEGYSTDGRFISPSASIGKRFYITDTISFTPEINATYLAQWIDGSTSALTLSIEDRFIDTVFGHVQGSVKKVIKRDNSTIIGELRGGLYMSRQLHGDETNLSVVSNQFTIDTSREDVVSPYVGIGATWEIADNFKLSADGEMDFGDLDGGRARFGASLSF